MHLMVLGASRHGGEDSGGERGDCLNAPDGAGCFPTFDEWLDEVTEEWCLNAPDGAGCFPTLTATVGIILIVGSQCT